jgi:hypothetical protein
LNHSHEQSSPLASRCPLCGENNGCAVQAGNDPAGCWCMSARIPKALLEQVPPAQRGKACVCQSCVEAYKSKQAGGTL